MTSEEMTREEAVEIIVRLPLLKIATRDPIDKVSEALSMAVEALEQKRPHGEWIPCKDDNFCKCSECQQIVMSEERSKFCPNCGADMRGGKHGEDSKP